MKLLSLATGQIITRDHFHILPITTLAINRMNELALKDDRRRSATVVAADATMSSPSLGVSVAEQTGTGTAAETIGSDTAAARGDTAHIEDNTGTGTGTGADESAADGDIRGASESTVYESAADGDIRGVRESAMNESAATKDTADSQADAGGEHTPPEPNYDVTEVNDNDARTNDAVIN